MSNLDLKRYLNVYEFETELPGSGQTVKFRPMTTGQMKKLLVYENVEDPLIAQKALNELIKGCVVSDMDLKELYIQDNFFLLVEIRKATKGKNYKLSGTCPKCQSQFLNVINLDNLPVKNIPEKMSNNVEIFKDLSVTLDFLRVSDQEKAMALIERNPAHGTQAQKAVDFQIHLHALAIKEFINEEGTFSDVSHEDKVAFLENLPAEEYKKINKWFDDHDFGIDLKYEIHCNHCNEFRQEYEIPLNDFFA